MTQLVDGHSNPCMQSVARPTHHHRRRSPLVGKGPVSADISGF